MMQLGAEGVFVGSGIFKSDDPAPRAARDRRGDDALRGPASASRAASEGLGDGDGRRSRRASSTTQQLLANRGW